MLFHHREMAMVCLFFECQVEEQPKGYGTYTTGSTQVPPHTAVFAQKKRKRLMNSITTAAQSAWDCCVGEM
jgi:hypothetical protein